MFTNLIESSSHAGEFKRRGSFFLFTTVTYALLFSVAGVLSIYAYDAELEEPASEITMLSPLDFEPPPVPTTPNVQPVRSSGAASNTAKRIDPMASVNRPDLVPKTTSVAPNRNPPVPDRGSWEASNVNTDPSGSGVPGTNRNGGDGDGRNDIPNVDVGTPPPPAQVEKPRPKVLRKTVLNGEAILLPKPVYPPIAKQTRVQGTVTIQVLVDEQGHVVSANVVKGDPRLAHAARQAAMQARFSPTMLGDQPVKVSGVITYNFVLQ